MNEFCFIFTLLFYLSSLPTSVSILKHLPSWDLGSHEYCECAGWSDEAWRKVKHQSEYKRVRHKSRFIRLVFQPSVRGLGFCRLHSWAAYCWPAPVVIVVAAVAGGASCHPPTFTFHTFQFEWEKSGSNSVTLQRIQIYNEARSGDEKMKQFLNKYVMKHLVVKRNEKSCSF